MKKANTTPELHPVIIPADFTPSDEQIDALARRFVPEIKRFFADDEIQREFAEWKEQQATGK
jgi:hypothetical protein